MALGLAALAAGGPALVEGALRLSSAAGVSQSAVGLTLVSLGTGAEMIAIGVTAARRRASELFVGGVFGSLVYNELMTLGVAALVRPLPVGHMPATLIFAGVMLGVQCAVFLLIFTTRRINRVAGGALIALYVAYLAAVILTR